MATIFKRRELRPIPEGAEIGTYRGKRYAKWTDTKDNAQRAQLNEAGDRIIWESPYYTIKYFDHTGQRLKVSTKCADKDAAQQLANELESRAMMRREGIIDPTAERIATEGRRSLQEHVDDFLAYMAAKGNTAAHVNQTGRQIQRLIAECHAQQVGDLTGSTVLGVIGSLRDSGTSLRTCNSYLRAIKTFTRWLRKEKRTPDDDLAGLSQYNESTDRRHIRRELTPEETMFLLAHVEQDDRENYKLSGPARAMAYRVALGTGFRVKELRTLTPTSFDLQADPPTVTVAAAYSKRRRQDVQPIRSDLADTLRPWLADRPRDERLFRLPHNTSKMFQRDLAAARAAWIAEARTDTERQRREDSDFLRYADADGKVADFHAQRHTFISGIVATGASVKTAQELARHSTPVLTIGRYSHTRLHDLTGALDAMPSLQPSGNDLQARRATGTDGTVALDAKASGTTIGTSNPAKRDETEPDEGGETDPRNDNAVCRNVLKNQQLGDKRRNVSKVVRGGIEPPTHGFSVCEQTAKSSGKRPVSDRVGPRLGPVETKTCSHTPDLQAVIDAWDGLPDAIRAGILAMVRSTREG